MWHQEQDPDMWSDEKSFELIVTHVGHTCLYLSKTKYTSGQDNHIAHLQAQDPLLNIFFLLILDISNRLYNVIASDTCVVFNMHV